MFTIGEFVNTTKVNSNKNTIKFEKYCKDEGISSIYLRREVYSLYKNKRKNFFESIFSLVINMFMYS